MAWGALSPIVKGAIIGGGVSLAGGALSAKASAKQAQKQMDFQERMSNTAFQRSAADLEAAGLNRILALGSPATTPGGAMGQVPNYGSAMAEGANAAMSGVSSASSINKQQEEIKRIIQETKILSEKEKQVAMTSKIMERFGGLLLQATHNLPQLMEHLTSPEFRKELTEIILPDIAESFKKGTVSPGLSFIKLLYEKTGDKLAQTQVGKVISNTLNNIKQHKHSPSKRKGKYSR